MNQILTVGGVTVKRHQDKSMTTAFTLVGFIQLQPDVDDRIPGIHATVD